MAGVHINRYPEFTDFGRQLNNTLFAGKQPVSSNTLVVLVTHSFYSALPSIEAAAHIAGKQGLYVVLKSSSRNDAFERDLVDDGVMVSGLRKGDFKKNPDKVTKRLKEACDEARRDRILILDHGGYASYHLQDLMSELPIAGIVEYTINGQKKYDKLAEHGAMAQNLLYSSVAKSELKKYPDFSCGRLIGSLMEDIVRGTRGFGIHLRDRTQFGVIGYGNLGSKVAEQLRKNGAHNIMIFDVNPAKMIQAYQDGHNIRCETVAELVSKCNVIVVGTDTAPIKPEMYGAMQDETYIATVTSADDSLGLPELLKERAIKRSKDRRDERLVTYETQSGKKVHLIHNGEAPNLIGGMGVDDTTIFLPNLLHVYVGREMLGTGQIPSEGDVGLMEQEIQRGWLGVTRSQPDRNMTRRGLQV